MQFNDCGTDMTITRASRSKERRCLVLLFVEYEILKTGPFRVGTTRTAIGAEDGLAHSEYARRRLYPTGMFVVSAFTAK